MIFSDLPSSLPSWATTDAAICFYYGFAMGATVRIYRAAMKWMKKVGNSAE